MICTSIQLAMQVYASRKAGEHEGDNSCTRESFLLFSVVVLILLLSHKKRTYLRANALRVTGFVATKEEAILSASAKCWTAGYSDIILPAENRNFGTMAAVKGILTFRLTTALLVFMFRRNSALLSDD